MRKLIIIISVLFLSISMFSVNAQELGDTTFYQLTIDDLTPITVASNVITEKGKQPVSVTTITNEQLELSGARLLSEAIMMYVPGFFFVEDQDDQIAAFRGLAADNNSKVLLLVNGQNMNTEFFWGPADAILNSTNYAYIEKIEIIRGPGSVTLGQGALLGVINIVTKDPSQLDGINIAKSDIQFNVGPNNTFHGSADLLLNSRQLDGYFYVSTNRYGGQDLRPEGWAVEQNNEGFAGGQVADMGHGLHRTDNVTFTGNVNYKKFSLSVIHSDQMKDLYNFYRDREVFQQVLTSVSTTYTHDFSKRVRLSGNINYAQDHFSLSSRTGTIMGGTREDRFGLKAVLTLDKVIPNNKLAIGLEGRQFRMGKKNMLGNNFIANVIGTFDPITANEELQMGFRQNINVASIFLEDFYSINDQFDVFFAFRNDNHPFWGNSFTPRLGVLYSPNKTVNFRLSYQSGFRGAVGLHYTGGYRRDGFLRASNYSLVDDAAIPITPLGAGQVESDIPETNPERMNSLELAVTYQPNKSFEANVVGFYNTVEDVIDVGVIYRDPQQFDMVNIGSDAPGDWNGFWYFKNTPGRFQQVGLEASIKYQGFKWEVGASQSLVSVAQATEEQRALAESGSSMYLTADDEGNLHFKAYPESVTRVYAVAKPFRNLRIGVNAIGYSRWFSPQGEAAAGGLLMNSSAFYQVTKNLDLGVSGRNLLGENALYPMNSNSGGPTTSPGTPTVESTTFWITLRLSLQ